MDLKEGFACGVAGPYLARGEPCMKRPRRFCSKAFKSIVKAVEWPFKDPLKALSRLLEDVLKAFQRL